MLTANAVNQFFGSGHTLRDISLEIPTDGFMCLMGRNGVGKTTLLKVIMGLLPMKSGSVKFGERDISALSTEARARLGIGYVPQGRDIFPLLSVEENMRISLPAATKKTTDIPSRIFELFPVLKKMLHRRGGDLSGGQQQQLAIARALILNPSLLILDEPTEGIQPNVVREIGDVLMHLNKSENMGILLVEQKLPFARRVAKEFCILERGQVSARGRMEELTGEIVARHLSV